MNYCKYKIKIKYLIKNHNKNYLNLCFFCALCLVTLLFTSIEEQLAVSFLFLLFEVIRLDLSVTSLTKLNGLGAELAFVFLPTPLPSIKRLPEKSKSFALVCTENDTF